jgi:succinoglycan biosynthesis transport protein ExoP
MEANRTDDNKGFATPESKLHFLDYWRIIRIRKTVILAVFLLVALTTTVVTFLLPPAYKSMVKISIEQDMTDVDPQQRGFLVRPTVDPFFVQTEFQRIQSKPVLYKVITNLHLCEEWGRKYNQGVPISNERAFNYLKGSIDVQQSHNTTLIEIHGFSDDKDEAAKLANTVAEVYTEVRSEARSGLKKGGIEALRKILLAREEAITNQQKIVNSLRSSLEIADWEAAANQPTPSLDQETLRQINSGLREAMRSFDITTNIYAKLVVLPREALKEAAPLQVPNASRLIELINQETSSEQKLATMGKLGSEHPDVRSATELLRTIRRQLDEALSGLTNALEIRMQTEKATVQGYRNQLEEARRKDSENYAKTRPYYEARDVLAQMKYNRERLAQTVENTEVELSTPSKGAVQIIELAEANPVPYKPRKGLTIGIGVAAGLLIGLLLAFFIEYLDTSVKTIDDVERALQAPVLGVIPQNVGLLMNEGAESPHAEAYRVLRTNVLFSRKDPKLNTLTIVSGGAGEGKSTTIFNLATVFAQNGQRVLVVDSDLRRPSLHKHLGVSNALGLTNYLLKQNSLDEVVQTTKQTNLDFLPSGRLPSSSMGILSSMQMKELIRDVKRRYDFVFFDSPPIMGVSDASILASEVDMVLQVIQYRRYPQPMTIRAKQMIEKVGGNLLGIVLNNINVSQDENYYYYSGYYYDYTKGDDGDAEKKQEAKAAAKEAKEAKVEIKSKF